MPKVVLTLALAIVCFALLDGGLAAPRPAAARPQLTSGLAVVVHQIDHYRTTTWRWQHVMGLPATPVTQTPVPNASLAYRMWVLRLWEQRAAQAQAKALNPPHRGEWLCIHRYEGSWTDRGAPYYGGLQMDISFQRAYGRYLLDRKGTADNWTPLEQMWVAERAYRSGRGFYAWPNTARYCGLI